MRDHGKGLILGLFVLVLAHGTALGFQCGESDTTNWRNENTAPCTGDTKAFVLLIKFPNDNGDPNACYTNYWPNSIGHALPDWADTNNLLHPDTTSANFARGSLSEFWDMMSVGNYCFYGDVYDTVYQPEYNTGYYETHYACGDTSALLASGYVIWEALTNIDDAVDFSQYDNNPRDGVVDAIQIVFRAWYNFLQSAEGVATLGDICDPDSIAEWPIVTDDTTVLWNPDTESYDTLAVTIEKYSGTKQIVVNNLGALAVMGHEWGHRLGLGELASVGEWGVMDPNGSGTAMCAFARWSLGWLTPREFPMTADSTDVVLQHSIPTGDVLKILADTVSVDTSHRSFFLIENRQRATFFDTLHTEYTSNCSGETPGEGLLVTEVYWDYDGEEWDYDIKCANWQYKWFDPGDHRNDPDRVFGRDDLLAQGYGTASNTFNEANNNTFASYTAPGTYVHYCESGGGCSYPAPESYDYYVHTGFGLCNVHKSETSDTDMVMDLYFGMPEDEINKKTKWSGRIVLDGDVTITDSLEIATGTEVWMADNWDYNKSGLDTMKAEIVVADGGVLDATGTSADWIKFIPDSTETWLPGDWYGIVMEAGGEATLEYCEIGYGASGVRDSLSTVSIENCNIHGNSSHGIWVVDGNPEIVSTTIDSNSTYGIYVEATESASVRSSTFLNHTTHVKTADSDLDLGDMSTPGPGNAGWNRFSGGDTCLKNTDTDTLLAEGNYWGSDDADTVAAKINGPVDYDPWLPLHPDSISVDSSTVTVVDTNGVEVEDDIVRQLCAFGDGNTFVLRFTIFDEADSAVGGMDPLFLYAVVQSDTVGPTCECAACTTHFGSDSHRFYCQTSNDTIFAVDSTSSEGISDVEDGKIGASVRLLISGYLGQLQIEDSKIVWINSADLVADGASYGKMNGSDFSAFSTHYNRNRWAADYVHNDSCDVGGTYYQKYNVTGPDFAWFSQHYAPHASDSTTCE